MKNFNDGFMKEKRGFGNGPKFGGERKTGGYQQAGRGVKSGGHKFGGNDRSARSSERTEMFAATCSNCHKSCEVPFRPNGEKPVFCNNCFERKAQDGSLADRRGGHDSRRSDRPTQFSKPNRESAPANNGAEIRELKGQLVTIEARLNRILDLLNPPQPSAKQKAVMSEEVSVKELVTAAPVKKVTKKVSDKKLIAKKVATKKTVSKKTAKKATKKIATKKK